MVKNLESVVVIIVHLSVIMIQNKVGGKQKVKYYLLLFLEITGFKSSVISISFHPSNRVIACGSSDFSLKIITACIVE